MNSDVENIWDPEDYRYGLHELNRKYQKEEISSEEYLETLKKAYSDCMMGALCKYDDLCQQKNPFVALWGKALQEADCETLETGLQMAADHWDDFIDFVFAVWFLRNAERMLNIETKPLMEANLNA